MIQVQILNQKFEFIVKDHPLRMQWPGPCDFTVEDQSVPGFLGRDRSHCPDNKCTIAIVGITVGYLGPPKTSRLVRDGVRESIITLRYVYEG